jgi:adenylate cyclase
MAELVAQGKKPSEFQLFELVPHRAVVLGRDPSALNVPWEPWLSQRHAEIVWRGDVLHVRQLPSARNPIFFRGEPARSLDLKPGEAFVIGATLFSLADSSDHTQPLDAQAIASRTIDARELDHVPFRDAPGRLDVLTRLPEIITSAANEKELFVHLINLLLAGIPRASAAARGCVEVHAG